MTLVEIDLSIEPVCLQELRANAEMTYGNLEGECREAVISLLKKSQFHLCAYCQKSIENVMTIEHYIAQSDVNNNGQNLQLSFSNFLGVCTGKFYLNKIAGTHEEHCDTSRGNFPLNIDPKMPEHIATISYTDDFKIISTDHDFNSDLNNILNLNIDEISDLRQKTFNDYIETTREYWPEIPSMDFYRKALQIWNITILNIMVT